MYVFNLGYLIAEIAVFIILMMPIIVSMICYNWKYKTKWLSADDSCNDSYIGRMMWEFINYLLLFAYICGFTVWLAIFVYRFIIMLFN